MGGSVILLPPFKKRVSIMRRIIQISDKVFGPIVDVITKVPFLEKLLLSLKGRTWLILIVSTILVLGVGAGLINYTKDVGVSGDQAIKFSSAAGYAALLENKSGALSEGLEAWMRYPNDEVFFKRVEDGTSVLIVLTTSKRTLRRASIDPEQIKSIRTGAQALKVLLPGAKSGGAAERSKLKSVTDKIKVDIGKFKNTTWRNLSSSNVNLKHYSEKVIELSMIGMGALALFLISSLVYVLRMVGWLGSIREGAFAFLDGNRDVQIPHCELRNEIGDLARAINDGRKHAIESERLKEVNVKEHETSEKEKRKAAFDTAMQLKKSSHEQINLVSEGAVETQKAADRLNELATDIDGLTDTATNSAESASINVSTVASGMEEFHASVKEISVQVDRTSILTGKATDCVNGAGKYVEDLRDYANKIGQVVQFITDIAEQTNLLALNATIEAARAGDAGKGFAVVAAEVKNLANETAKATDQIGGQVSEIQNVARNVATSLEEVTSSVSEVNLATSTVASAVTQQEATANEITNAIGAAADGVKGSTSVVMELASGARQIRTLSATVDEIANQSAHEVNSLEKKLSLSIDKAVGEQRHYSRVAVDFDAEIDGHSAHINNISGGGASLDANGLNTAIGEHLSVNISKAGVSLSARVLECGEGQVRLQFETSEETHHRLEEFLEPYMFTCEPHISRYAA